MASRNIRITREEAIRVCGTEERLNTIVESHGRHGGEMFCLKTGAKLYLGKDDEGEFFGIYGYCPDGDGSDVTEMTNALDRGESWLVTGDRQPDTQ
jgi:hypothetical protein